MTNESPGNAAFRSASFQYPAFPTNNVSIFMPNLHLQHIPAGERLLQKRCGISRGFYAAAPGQTARVTRCISGSVRALISRQSRETRLRQLAQTSLRKPHYRHRDCLPGSAAGNSQLRGSGVNLTVRETGVNPAVREDGEHFCEAPEQKFYIRRPSKSEDCGRRPNKRKTAELLRVLIFNPPQPPSCPGSQGSTNAGTR